MKTLIVDDDPKRIEWFRSIYPDTKFAMTAFDGIELLTKEQFDVVSLDHDLEFHHYKTAMDDVHDHQNCHDGGCDIARAMAKSNIRHTSITIHSWNRAATRAMARILHEAGIRAFMLRAECG